MKSIKTLTISTLLIASLSSSIYAKECFNADNIDVKWTSFKTLAKVGVSGTFNDVKLTTPRNANSLKTLLKDAQIAISFKNIDAKSAVKNENILKYFVANLETQNITGKITGVNQKELFVEFQLNKTTKIIPMKYLVKDNQVIASGVIDGMDFGMKKALFVLNKNVAGHLNKGWFDIPISFSMNLSKQCK
ncbi:hypothetical protein [Sulfurimonas sp.]|uniref:hypothetical protein n=1 Tax=Sulfurimonas sp. TaxID=2022749 RepID=UPI002B48E470|nr:hypothetical protein [Sulfurimonas sp.]